MTNKQIDEVLKLVAIKNGVTIDEVRSEIEEAIAIAQSNPSKEVQKQWENISPNGEVATLEAVINSIVDKLKS